MIEKLPFGYDTLLDRAFKKGHDLSGGQWQRLVSARAFYRDAALLICDEPSSALDARAEHAIFQQLRAHPARTIVLITHRLANVRHADHIYVLHEGRVVQHGDHDTLMDRGRPVPRAVRAPGQRLPRGGSGQMRQSRAVAHLSRSFVTSSACSAESSRGW